MPDVLTLKSGRSHSCLGSLIQPWQTTGIALAGGTTDGTLMPRKEAAETGKHPFQPTIIRLTGEMIKVLPTVGILSLLPTVGILRPLHCRKRLNPLDPNERMLRALQMIKSRARRSRGLISPISRRMKSTNQAIWSVTK